MTDTSTLRRLAEKELGVPASLHDYQWEGVAFLYNSSRALLADEMGLGKTVQAAVATALLMTRHDQPVGRALIVAPASLVSNWLAEFSSWTPTLTVRCVHGNARDREAFYLLPIPVLIASYDQIRSDGLDRIPSGTFDLVILDEAQRIKNRFSATALACRLLPRKRSWALSATPFENSSEDVESILRFLDPLQKSERAAADISIRLRSMMLRRRKLEVRNELPAVIFQDLMIDLSSSQRDSYEALWAERHDSLASNTNARAIGTALLGLIVRLKLICNFDEGTSSSSKVEALSYILEDAGQAGRVIVFSQFVDTLKWISARISVPHELLIGSLTMEARGQVIERFSTGTTPRALLVSIKAGGVGLNLGSASHVVLFDRWWNPATEMQAIYRAHRFDRSQPLHVIRFLVKDSIEEDIAAVLSQKQRMFEDVVESVESANYRFTEEELLRILGLSVRDTGTVAQKEVWRNGENL